MTLKLIVLIVYTYAYTGGNYEPVYLWELDLTYVTQSECEIIGDELVTAIQKSIAPGVIEIVDYWCVGAVET